MKKLYVGNLSYDATEEDLTELFGEYGEVVSAVIIFDKYSNRSKGFGFVEMADDSQADAAVAALDGSDMKGRTIKVNEAREKREGGGGGNRRGGGQGRRF